MNDVRSKIEHELDEMMIGTENYFGARNPKRNGHIRCALDRIMTHVPQPTSAPPNKSETTKSEDRVRVAYDAFRNGFDGGVLPPEWDKAPSWIRDAIHVAYLQGKLDSAR